ILRETRRKLSCVPRIGRSRFRVSHRRISGGGGRKPPTRGHPVRGRRSSPWTSGHKSPRRLATLEATGLGAGAHRRNVRRRKATVSGKRPTTCRTLFAFFIDRAGGVLSRGPPSRSE